MHKSYIAEFINYSIQTRFFYAYELKLKEHNIVVTYEKKKNDY